MVNYVVTIDTAAASRRLQAFAMRSFADLMEILGTLVEGQVKRRISSEKTSPDGVPWAPLKASTALKKGSSAQLVDTGRLLGSISHTSTSSTATVGTNVFYAPFQHYGTRHIPARPFMGISEENMAEIRRAVDAWVERVF